ncbi:7a-methyl-1,5-dioxo-octahydro-1H-inden-4-yl [Seminavis robusta]|uniref:7a-methyl-1,5-dioxo-octahydro-1H-inden-4-yl n=1 Tax=Seminavis robusta TaxID=568900 RepID=A0A9N8DWJ2_9STRA|nr:7a-methyl-1,5-dioxo-octahydro-1H-inden-4-yl [Seminavis robusta]|eukprot:Sro326_g118140.1 7a-methyl-1,5-dioxo-octahydro-1H-inden-4-yl (666) ;mRNA; f:45440-47437
MAPSSTKSLHTPLTYAVAAWGSIAATTCLIRWHKRRSIKAREGRVAQNMGLMPQVQNVVDALAWRAANTPNDLALEAADGTAQYTWEEYYQQVQQFGRSLLAMPKSGKQCGVAIHAFNEPRWFFAAIGALAAEWTISGIYLTNTYPQAAHVLKTSAVKVLVLESQELLDSTYATVLTDFPELTVVLLQGAASISTGGKDRVVTYEEFLKANNNNTTTLKTPKSLDPDTVITNIFTSGTTGNPKAVELTHMCAYSVCAMMHSRIPLDTTTKVVSYLPLSHIAAMGIDVFSSIFCGASVHFADSNALRGSLKDTLLRVRPTLFFGVPRVWEKMSTAMQQKAAESYAKPVTGAILKSIGTAAKAVGRAWWSSTTPEWVKCGFLVVPFGFFKILAYKKVRRGCGLDRCRLLFTGAAPLPTDTLWYLRSLDMPLLEVFGMSESTGAIAVCGPNDFDRPLGSCGAALPMGQLTIAPEDGEILWKGQNNMIGYKGLPAATKATLNPETGNLHTGDIGKVDSDGYVYITGRKKDLIITAGGENVAPTPIEEAIMSLLNGKAGHVVLVGDQRKFLTVLIAPTENGTMPTQEQVEAAMKEYNTNHAKSRAQRVQKAHVLESPLDVQTGELTPTMKVKRAFVLEKFSKDVNAMYEDGSSKLVGYTSMNIGNLASAI